MAQLSGLVFVVSSMVAMGLSLTGSRILAPVRDPRRVLLALGANFILVPIAAYVLSASFRLSPTAFRRARRRTRKLGFLPMWVSPLLRRLCAWPTPHCPTRRFDSPTRPTVAGA